MTSRTKNDRHGEFVALLGDRLIGRYTDGGAGPTRNKVKHAASKVARRRQKASIAARSAHAEQRRAMIVLARAEAA
jgi:hypothetical protein